MMTNLDDSPQTPERFTFGPLKTKKEDHKTLEEESKRNRLKRKGEDLSHSQIPPSPKLPVLFPPFPLLFLTFPPLFPKPL